jgi:hypothetical protein
MYHRLQKPRRIFIFCFVAGQAYIWFYRCLTPGGSGVLDDLAGCKSTENKYG